MPIGSWQEPDIKLLLDMPYKITVKNQADLKGWAKEMEFGEYDDRESCSLYLQYLLDDYNVKDFEVTISLTDKGN